MNKMFLLIVMLLAAPVSAADYYVWDQATGDGSGNSWANGYASLLAIDQAGVVQQVDQVFVASDHQEHHVNSTDQTGYWWLRFSNLDYDSPMIMSVNRGTLLPEIMEDAGGHISFDYVVTIVAKTNWGCLNFVANDRGVPSQTKGSAPTQIRIARGDFFQCDFDSQHGPFFVGDPYQIDAIARRVKLTECCLMVGSGNPYAFFTREPNTHITAVRTDWISTNLRADAPFFEVGNDCSIVLYQCGLFMGGTSMFQFDGDNNHVSVLGCTSTVPLTVNNNGFGNTFVEE